MENIMGQLQDNSKFAYREFKNVNRDLVSWLEDIIDENHCTVERKEWQSRYNIYVVFDYVPFCADGFEINLQVSSHDYSYLEFVNQLYVKRVADMEHLNRCAELECKSTFLEKIGIGKK